MAAPGILSRLLPWRRKEVTTASNPGAWLVDWFGGGGSTLSGISVTPESAMRTAAVWACIRVRSEDIGKVPCFLYRRIAGGGKERASDHPLYRLIHDAPNPRMTAFEFKQLLQAQMDLHGNGYALKEFDLRGQLIALWPIPPTRVTVLATPDYKDLFYQIRFMNGSMETIPAEGIMHLRGLTIDGILGLSPIAYHRETVALGMAAEKYGAAFFGNNAQPRGAVKVPGTVGEKEAQLLRESWEQKYRGVENAHRIAILDGGMEWIPTGMNNTDAQFMETRKMQNQEIWRIYRVPAHKVGDLERSTYSNIEQQALEYVIDCLTTEFKRWEQTLARDLLSENEQKTLLFEFLPDALLRGDLKSRFDAYAIARNWGFLSVNEIRERENLNRVPAGDIMLQPLNMVEAGKPPAQPGGAPGSKPAVPNFTEPGADPAQTLNLSPSSAQALLRLAAELVAREGSGEIPWPLDKRHINGNGSGIPEN